ncbi:polymer-forming cytoskeletal protein [Nevskia sp.]|uniref:bactofilin family protein n=1 Tax=Nevskia sp. TaxID=1929292 RepID=UPI0025FEFE11|nr:polymer-forming cytoskeletal protein [Nevskia sp.]
MKGFLGSGSASGGKSGSSVDTLIGRQTEILGDVRFSGGLHLDGRIKGTVSMAGGQAASATLSISETGTVEGDIRVPNVILNGTVIGDVHATEKLVLNAKARVNGNVHYAVLQMEPGATINGQLVHDSGESAVATRSESAVLAIQDARRSKQG